MFYRLVSKNYLSNTKTKYTSLSKNTVKAREDGRLPINCFSDSTRRIIDGFNENYETIDQYVYDAVSDLENLGEFWKNSYPRWHKQPEYVEVWIEKEALTETFNSILSGKDVIIVPNKGYPSETFYIIILKDLATRNIENTKIFTFYILVILIHSVKIWMKFI